MASYTQRQHINYLTQELRKAIQTGNVALAEEYLLQGADPNDKGALGSTPLMEAIDENNTELVKLLLAYHASVKKRNAAGGNCMHRAAVVGSIEIIQILLNHDVKIDSKNKYNETPLMYAAENDNLEAYLFLIKNGASPLLENIDGQTAFKIFEGSEKPKISAYKEQRELDKIAGQKQDSLLNTI